MVDGKPNKSQLRTGRTAEDRSDYHTTSVLPASALERRAGYAHPVNHFFVAMNLSYSSLFRLIVYSHIAISFIIAFCTGALIVTQVVSPHSTTYPHFGFSESGWYTTDPAATDAEKKPHFEDSNRVRFITAALLLPMAAIAGLLQGVTSWFVASIGLWAWRWHISRRRV